MSTRTPLRIVLLVLAVALVASACGGSDDVVATVDGEEITASEVEALISESPENPEAFTEALATLIQWQITTASAANDLGIEITEDQLEEDLQGLLASMGASSVSELSESQNIPEDLLRRYVAQLALMDAVTASFEESVEQPSPDAVATELADNPLAWTEVCAAHVLVETEEEANEVLARLEAGEDFADIAAEVSLDSGSGAAGGDLGCASPEDYVAPFAEATMAATIGEPHGPVESEFGFHVILVNSRSDVGDEAVSAYLLEAAVVAAADEWFIEAVEAAVVEVDASYGEWTTDPTPRIVPG